MAEKMKSSVAHPGKGASTSEMFEYLISIHLETRDITTANQKEIIQLKTRVDTLEKENIVLKKDLRDVKEIVNQRDQEARSLTVRIFGVPLSEEEKKTPNQTKLVSKSIYDRVLRPLLTAAKTSSDIESIPQAANVIEDCFRIGKGTKDKQGRLLPPPVLVRLTSSKLKVAIFRNKRRAMPDPSEAELAMGILRFSMVEDLTPATFSMLRELREDDRVFRAWTTEGKIRFTLNTDKNVVVRVSSVYDPIGKYVK
jgi:hypothetical protein